MGITRLSYRAGYARCLMVTLAAVAVGCPAWLAVPAQAASGRAVPAARTAVPAAGSWGTAIEVPGLAALNKGGSAEVLSVSCGLAGSCAAGGDYTDLHGHPQGFVADESNGVWGTAIEVPGLGALNKSGDAQVRSVSCAAAGNCAAGGYYHARRSGQGFVAVERNGRWSRAIEVPGLGALNTGGDAQVLSVSCASAGSCAAGGYYTVRSKSQGFVAVERNGRWGRAIKVPGLAALSPGGFSLVNSVSCGSAGSCAAGGYYHSRRSLSARHLQGFVAAENKGVWGRAIGVPGLAALNKGGFAQVSSVSCGSAGNCAAGGVYDDRHFNLQGFVAEETNGVWGQAIEVPGLAALNTGFAQVFSVSCASAGNCAAGGSYDALSSGQGFVADESNGVWGQAIEVPGLAALNTGAAEVISVSCASAGNCAAGGFYLNGLSNLQGFVVSETNGVWGQAIEVPGLAALNKGQDGAVNSVSCASAGSCAAGGSYVRLRHSHGYVT